MHNETMNAWSHILGSCYFFVHLILAYLRWPPFDEYTQQSSTVLTMVAAFCCGCSLLCSSVYHLYNPINEEVFLQLLKLDLVGIAVQIIYFVAL